MARVSDTVQEKIKELYATMATAAARKAIARVEWNDPDKAEEWAKHAEKWLIRAGAAHARRTYERPKP